MLFNLAISPISINWDSLLIRALLTLIPAYIAYKKGHSFWIYYIAFFIVSPVIGLIWVCFIRNESNEDTVSPSNTIVSTHEDKLEWAYNFLLRNNENAVQAAFPYGKQQMGQIIKDISTICGLDINLCDSQKYMRMARVYLDIKKDPAISSAQLISSYKDIVKDGHTASVLVLHFNNSASND